MGFYAATYETLNERHPNCICMDASAHIGASLSFKSKTVIGKDGKALSQDLDCLGKHRLVLVENLFDNPNGISSALNQACKFDSMEIVCTGASSIEPLLSLVAVFLVDHELSVGILFKGMDEVAKWRPLLDKYGVFVTSGKRAAKPLQQINVRFSKVAGSFDHLSKFDGPIPSFMLSTSLKKIDLDESFREKLLRYMNKSNKTNVEIYTAGGITRQVFSKIISSDAYLPKKQTIFCLIIGMELCLDDALDLLNAAGYTLSNSIMSDCILKRALRNGHLNLDEINRELDENSEPILGWKPREE